MKWGNIRKEREKYGTLLKSLEEDLSNAKKRGERSSPSLRLINFVLLCIDN